MSGIKLFRLFKVPRSAGGGGVALIKKHRFEIITLVYWFLLLYIIAALVYWFIVLEQQNDLMAALRMVELKKETFDFNQQFAEIQEQHKRKTIQYISEGSTFLILIVVGASFVYRAVRKQILLGRQQQNFMMAVTHELKTPIAITQLNLETLQKRALGEQQQQKLIANTLQETKRLNELTNNILVASQLETGTYLLHKQEVNLGELAGDAMEDFKRRFPKRVIDFTSEENIFVEGERTLLQMLLNNLVDNALKYSVPTAPVKVDLFKREGDVLLTVTDEGEGIENVEKKKVFQKFYRTGNEATRKTKGTGLGLYLCSIIVKDHRGHIFLADNKPKGVIFTVLLKAL